MKISGPKEYWQLLISFLNYMSLVIYNNLYQSYVWSPYQNYWIITMFSKMTIHRYSGKTVWYLIYSILQRFVLSTSKTLNCYKTNIEFTANFTYSSYGVSVSEIYGMLLLSSKFNGSFCLILIVRNIKKFYLNIRKNLTQVFLEDYLVCLLLIM